MNEKTLEIKAALDACFTVQSFASGAWHDSEPSAPAWGGEQTLEGFRNLVLLEHLSNFQLWHVEDRARRMDVSDSVIADCKRSIDGLNQKRNDYIEEIDKCLTTLILPHLPKGATSRINTETLGMAIDRLSILALKIFHMEEQTHRTDVTAEHIESCRMKFDVLRQQRKDLITAVLELMDDYAAGQKRPVLYSQFKMYNDPELNPEVYASTGQPLV